MGLFHTTETQAYPVKWMRIMLGCSTSGFCTFRGDHCVSWKGKKQRLSQAYPDVDYVGFGTYGCPTPGFYTVFQDHLISWKGKKQTVVSWFSAEVEYHVME